jgi:hypothetical protein
MAVTLALPLGFGCNLSPLRLVSLFGETVGVLRGETVPAGESAYGKSMSLG